MGQEIERKFLVTDDEEWRGEHGIKIVQGYLNLDKERTVRVRKKGDRSFITIKGRSSGASRKEFEYEIPEEDANELLKLCHQPLVKKIRREIKKDGKTWEIDEFLEANSGLLIAEIELKSEDEEVNLPEWVETEVTGDAKYFNSQLVKNPYSNWNKNIED